jgi:hypothetical protein
MLAGGPAVLPGLVALLTVLLFGEVRGTALVGVLALGFVVDPVAAPAPEVTFPPDACGCADAATQNITQSTAATGVQSTTFRLRLRNDAR